jgi:hypothetical protein
VLQALSRRKQTAAAAEEIGFGCEHRPEGGGYTMRTAQILLDRDGQNAPRFSGVIIFTNGKATASFVFEVQLVDLTAHLSLWKNERGYFFGNMDGPIPAESAAQFVGPMLTYIMPIGFGPLCVQHDVVRMPNYAANFCFLLDYAGAAAFDGLLTEPNVVQ